MHGFTGQRYDAETGLYYFKARYYSPKLGRFLQPDPIGYGDGLNIYTFGHNSPLNMTDPMGTEATNGGTSYPPPGTTRPFDAPPMLGGTANTFPILIYNVLLTLCEIMDLGWAQAFQNWLDRVKPGGVWDYKHMYPDRTAPEYVKNFANLNYGATAAALGFNQLFIQEAAGGIQILTSIDTYTKSGHVTIKAGWYKTFFDDPTDNFFVKMGIQWFHMGDGLNGVWSQLLDAFCKQHMGKTPTGAKPKQGLVPFGTFGSVHVGDLYIDTATNKVVYADGSPAPMSSIIGY